MTKPPVTHSILRLGVLREGRIVEDRLHPLRQSLSTGQALSNTLVLSDETAPETLRLFEVHGGVTYLQVLPSMGATLQVDGKALPLDQPSKIPGARQTRLGWAIPILNNSRGKLQIGKTTLLFQTVPPPVVAKSERSASTGFWFFIGSVLGLSGVFLFTTLLSFVVQTGAVAWLVYMVPPPQRVTGLQAMPDRFVRILEPPEEVEEEEEAPRDELPSDDDDGIVVEADAPEQAVAERAPEPETRTRADVREQAQQRVRQESALAAFYGGGDDATGPTLGFTTAITDRNAEDILRTQMAVGDGGGSGGIVSRSDLGTSSGAEGQVGRAAVQGGGSRVAEGATTERSEARQTVAVRSSIRSQDPRTAGSGELDADSLRSALRRRQGDIERCYERGLAQSPGLRGRVVVQFTVGSGGRVVDARLVENAVGDEVGNCILGRVRRWRFDEPRGGEASVAIPYLLEPGN